MLGIVFETTEEATPFVRECMNRRADGLEVGDRIRSGNRLVAVLGEGKIRATLATERLLRQYDLDVVVHAGGAVSLSQELETRSVLGATYVLEGDRVTLDNPAYPRMPLESPFDATETGSLVTQDHDSDDPDALSYWERIADARDSTGYCVAYVAGQHGTPCHIVKGITAQVGEESNLEDERAAYDAVAALLERELTSVVREAGE